ncbi:MAG: hypothetical protein IJK03_04175, partial [Oscillospiraceae bacterium]|nr:hypothetical protein [Oscillospiraceae bacterium]
GDRKGVCLPLRTVSLRGQKCFYEAVHGQSLLSVADGRILQDGRGAVKPGKRGLRVYIGRALFSLVTLSRL